MNETYKIKIAFDDSLMHDIYLVKIPYKIIKLPKNANEYIALILLQTVISLILFVVLVPFVILFIAILLSYVKTNIEYSI